MIIDCISDLHGYEPKLEGGDLLIVAGDLTSRDTSKQHMAFRKWIDKQPYKKKIVIAGNHDGKLVDLPVNCLSLSTYNFTTGKVSCYAEYLRDSGCEFEGLKIWGSPWTPQFCNWHFMKKRGQELKEVWDKIPMDTDILITHGPPYGILDNTELSSRGDKFNHSGCEELRLAMERVKPKLHVFGHIHEQGGKQLLFKHLGPNTICVNASIMDYNYNPTNKPVRIIL